MKLQVTNQIPNRITAWHLAWDVGIRAEFTTTGEKVNMASISSLQTHQIMFTCFDKPQQFQETPWVDIIWDANDWANGATNKMTANSNLVVKLYDQYWVEPGRRGYSRPAPQAIVTNPPNSDLGTQYTVYQRFWPLNFRSSIGAEAAKCGNCSDFANYLGCVMFAIGSAPDGAIHRFSSSPSSHTITQSISLAPGIPSQAYTNWVYHQVFRATGSAGAGYIYDGAMKIPSRIINYPETDYYSDAFSSPITWSATMIL